MTNLYHSLLIFQVRYRTPSILPDPSFPLAFRACVHPSLHVLAQLPYPWVERTALRRMNQGLCDRWTDSENRDPSKTKKDNALSNHQPLFNPTGSWLSAPCYITHQNKIHPFSSRSTPPLHCYVLITKRSTLQICLETRIDGLNIPMDRTRSVVVG